MATQPGRDELGVRGGPVGVELFSGEGRVSVRENGYAEQGFWGHCGWRIEMGRCGVVFREALRWYHDIMTLSVLWGELVVVEVSLCSWWVYCNTHTQTNRTTPHPQAAQRQS